MNNVRGLRDPRKRWVMHFDLQLAEKQILPVLLSYEPSLKERLDQIRSLFAKTGSIDVSTWWEPAGDGQPEILIGIVLSLPGSDETVLDLTIPLPRVEWESAHHRATMHGRETVLLSLTANPAVLQLQNDETSWETEVPLGEAQVRRETQTDGESDD
jgi:hypothetical protein